MFLVLGPVSLSWQQTATQGPEGGGGERLLAETRAPPCSPSYSAGIQNPKEYPV